MSAALPLSPESAPSQWLKDRRNAVSSGVIRLFGIAIGIAMLVGLLAMASRSKWFLPTSSSQADITAVVKRATLPIIVIAGGELESSATRDVFSEVEGQQIKIVEMLPEGTFVQANSVVMMLDPSDVKRMLSEQEIKLMKAETAVKTAGLEVGIQMNLADTALANATLAQTLAELDRKKYLDGDHQVMLSDLKGQIALAASGLQEAEVMVEAYERLVKKGFRTPQQMRAKEQDLARARHAFSRDNEKLRVLEIFTFDRQNAELTAKAAETIRVLERLKANAASAAGKATSDLLAAETTAKWEKSQLEKFKMQLQNCQVRSPQDGVVVYAKQEGKRVELGGTVHFKQQLFSLPDMTHMQVKAFVHESALRRIQPGQKAEIRIDAFRDAVMTGTVVRIDSFYDSVRHWMSGGVKEYIAIVNIDALPASISTKPGMSANVQITTGQLLNALVVPFPAIAEQGGKYVCYVASGDEVIRREVVLGDNTENNVEVAEGLLEGEKIMLNARSRALAEIRKTPDALAGPPLDSPSLTQDAPGNSPDVPADSPAATKELPVKTVEPMPPAVPLRDIPIAP